MHKGKKRVFRIIFLFFIAVLLTRFISGTQTYLNESKQWEQNLTPVLFSSTVSGDINNDGRLDLIITGLNNFGLNIAKIYINNGTTFIENSTWEQNLTGINYGSLSLGDINNDGKLDLALSGCSNGGGGLVALCADGGYQTFIYLNNGTGFFESSQWENNLTKSWKGSLAFGDINNDGKLDLALNGQSITGKISKIYINDGTSLIESPQWENSLTAVYESSLVFGDINNDGKLDLALCGDAGISDEISKIYINNGTSLIENSTWQQNLLGVDWCSLAFGDYNNDNQLDLSLIGHTTQDNHRIYKNNGTNFIQISPLEYGWGMTGIYDGSIAFGDYNNDGYLDIIANGWEGYTTLYLYNSSSANFTLDTQDPESQILDLDHGSSLVWMDINNDNSLDLIEMGANSTLEDDARIYLSNRSLTKNNTLPTPPNTLISSYSTANNTLTLGWNNGSDNETPSTGLYYNLMVGNSTTNNTIVSGVYGGSSNPTAGYFGNMMQRKNITLNLALPAGTYYWYVQTIDTGLAKSNWSARQNIVVGADTTSPNITSISSSVTSSTATITWTTDEMANSTVYYGTTTATSSKSSDISLTQSHSISLSGLSASTLYYYNVSSCDYSGNCNTSQQGSFTTSAAEAAPGNSPGGSGSANTGGGVVSFWTNTIIIGNENISAGIEKDLGKGQRVQLNVSGEKHYIGIINVNATLRRAIINISSNPIQVTLGIGEETRVDISNDGFYDIYVKLISIFNNKANLTIQAIHEEIIENKGNQTIDNNETISGEKNENEKAKLWLVPSIIVGAVILIFAGIFFYIKKVRKKLGVNHDRSKNR